MAKPTIQTDLEVFTRKLGVYKKLIDTDIAAYSKAVQKRALLQYGKATRLEVDAFLDILGRGGKRIRGSLVILGYEMSGGQDRRMIITAARALEMMHAYILIIDDIQDRSILRRGAPTAHVMLADHHEKHELAGDSNRFGVSFALNAALSGAHDALSLLAALEVPEKRRLQVLDVVNRTMSLTAHGQTMDIMNEVVAEVSRQHIEQVLEWKTAHYTFLSPLQVGMHLAGIRQASLEAITEYAMNAGKTYQITDDILGIFGTEFESGKSPMDDMREGKRTLLIHYALNHAGSADKNFLIQMLGNEHITPVEFHRCRDIIVQTGALEYAKAEAAAYIKRAVTALEKEKYRWSQEGVQFLRGLAEYLLTRSS